MRKQVNMSLSVEEFECLNRLSKKTGLTISEYCREKILAAPEKIISHATSEKWHKAFIACSMQIADDLKTKEAKDWLISIAQFREFAISCPWHPHVSQWASEIMQTIPECVTKAMPR